MENDFSQWFIINHDNGTAMISETPTHLMNLVQIIAKMAIDVAPLTFRMPISRDLR